MVKQRLSTQVENDIVISKALSKWSKCMKKQLGQSFSDQADLLNWLALKADPNSKILQSNQILERKVAVLDFDCYEPVGPVIAQRTHELSMKLLRRENADVKRIQIAAEKLLLRSASAMQQ
jgi:hypothetical protein